MLAKWALLGLSLISWTAEAAAFATPSAFIGSSLRHASLAGRTTSQALVGGKAMGIRAGRHSVSQGGLALRMGDNVKVVTADELEVAIQVGQ